MALTYFTEVDFESCAAELWRTHKLQPGFDVDDLVDKLGLGLVWDDIQDGTAGRVLGQLDPNDRAVILNQRYLSELEAREGRVRRYTLGHEIGCTTPRRHDQAPSACFKVDASGVGRDHEIQPNARPRCSLRACSCRGTDSTRRCPRHPGAAGDRSID